MPPAQLAQTLRSRILSQTSRIPKDPLRPNVQFGSVLTKLVEERSRSVESGEISGGWKDDDVRVLEGLTQGLDKLESNHWRKKYPFSRKTLVPSYKPAYYYRIGDAIDRAQRNEKKPWWRTFFGLEGAGLDERIKSGELDERIGLPPRKTDSAAPSSSLS
ncbi:hypothetical protein [Phaffia rhodozyma]|uniref:Uncharacterized protein n=1 Tax=Phaffia rhodozyma TaxID=264483 RepID=A0A0F7SM81_PHARH|nr:hypothetical protein [Phaffia rhodozyma]